MARREPTTQEVLPGELTTFRAVGTLGSVLGALGGIALWLTEPEEIRSTAVALTTTLVCVLMAAAMLLVPWERLDRRWLMTPAVVAAAVIAAAIQNMDGGREVYDGFYLYVALCAAYFMSARHVKIVIGIIAVASAVPLISDTGSDSIVRWLYVAAGNGTVAIVVRAARQRVRSYAAEVGALALHDQLTSALNRRGLEGRGGEAISRARRHGEALALVYLDLDGFKAVNDNLSHAAGDRVLRRAALAMAATLRGEDSLARVGGDEFVTLLADATDADADRVARRLIEAVESVAAVEPGAEHVSATAAWAAFPADGETLDALLNAADARMLERKRARGRSRAGHADPTPSSK